jgi:hypothetical protein
MLIKQRLWHPQKLLFHSVAVGNHAASKHG